MPKSSAERVGKAVSEVSIALFACTSSRASSLQAMLRSCGFAAHLARDLGEFASILSNNTDAGIVLTDLTTDSCTWQEVLSTSLRAAVPPSVIVLSHYEDAALWSDVLTQGGFDLLKCPCSCEELRLALDSAARRWLRHREIQTARQLALVAQPWSAEAGELADGQISALLPSTSPCSMA